MRSSIIILLTILGSTAYGQYYDKMYFVSWNINQPLSNTDYIGNTSTRGGCLGYRELINEKFSAGIDVSWSTYDDYSPRQTYTSSNGAVTTDFFKYVSIYSAALTGEYYFFTEKTVMPYVGFGLGAGYNDYKLYYNVFSSSEGAWGFLVRPQAGAWVRFGSRSPWALQGSIHFDYSSAKNENTGYDNFTNVGVQVGLLYLDW